MIIGNYYYFYNLVTILHLSIILIYDKILS